MEPVHVASRHWPPRTICRLLEHERHLLGPAPEQLAQLLSHDWHVREVASKNWFLLQVGRHRPAVAPVTAERTGRVAEQEVHWLKAGPEQVAQSGWQVRQAFAGGTVLEVEVKEVVGQVETHFPSAARRLPGQVKQKSAEPAQVPQEDEQAMQVRLSRGSTKLPAGQVSTHFPFARTNPGRH